MHTKVLKPVLTDLKKDTVVLNAVKLLKNNGIVGIPTETVYGLAANGFSEEAIKKIFSAKGRPADNPLIYHISEINELYTLTDYIPEIALTLAEAFWPGALTMIFKKKDIVPKNAVCGLDTVAVRMPDNAITLTLIRLCGFPLAAPSANISGSPSPTSAYHVLNDMNGKIPLILDGGECSCGVESTVVSFEKDNCVRILRPGAVTFEMLSKYADTVTDRTVEEKLPEGEKPISPGIKHKHYSPKAKVVLVKAESDEEFNNFILNQLNIFKAAEKRVYALVFNSENPPDCNYLMYGDSIELQARNLFSKLRELDGLNADIIFIRAPEKKGIGLAVYNRLIRAADFNIVDLKKG